MPIVARGAVATEGDPELAAPGTASGRRATVGRTTADGASSAAAPLSKQNEMGAMRMVL